VGRQLLVRVAFDASRLHRRPELAVEPGVRDMAAVVRKHEIGRAGGDLVLAKVGAVVAQFLQKLDGQWDGAAVRQRAALDRDPLATVLVVNLTLDSDLPLLQVQVAKHEPANLARPQPRPHAFTLNSRP
jgi:hypothetical protein